MSPNTPQTQSGKQLGSPPACAPCHSLGSACPESQSITLSGTCPAANNTWLFASGQQLCVQTPAPFLTRAVALKKLLNLSILSLRIHKVETATLTYKDILWHLSILLKPVFEYLKTQIFAIIIINMLRFLNCYFDVLLQCL